MLYLSSLTVLLCLGSGPREECTALLAPPRLEGTWALVYQESDGGSPMQVAGWSKTITPTLMMLRGPNAFRSDATYVLDPSGVPGWIDLTYKNLGKCKGIYRLKDNELTLCVNIASAGERPRDFTRRKKGQPVDVMRRIKP